MVTDDTSMTSLEGSFGVAKETYLIAEDGGRGDVGIDVARDQVEVLGVDLEDDLGARLVVHGDLFDLPHPADLHAVVGHLGAGIHGQTRTRRDHRQLGAGQEVAAELQIHHDDGRDGEQGQHEPGHLVGGLALGVDGSRHRRYTVRLKFGSTP
ncbi:hypothetical protein GCM10009645_05880 [Mycolicibacterium poriferae]|uniref:Uncharacterized protein n=1 Tax=Mycolicibacterium poriferae TaxID=39694 RepID=A0A6N4V6E5_9MYCO|nr:hypothetical protein [Mycolicibacterium poriferae]BBX49680.1 hypothetical protein MPOR_07060 [Mycolicibacterium poriferae]